MTISRPDPDRARSELYAVMNSSATFEEKAERALKIGTAFLEVGNGHLTTVDIQTNYWRAIASTDPADGTFPSGLTLDLSTTYCRRTIEQQESIALHDAGNQGWETDPAFKVHGLPTYHGTAISLDNDDDVFGTVCFVSESPREQPFSETETMFAELITRMLEFELVRDSQQWELDRRAALNDVFHRLLRHNLRNDMTVIRGHVVNLRKHLKNGADQVDVILSKTDSLVALSEKVRTLESRVTFSPWQEVNLIEELGRTIDEIETEYPEATIRIDGPREVIVDVMPGFGLAVRELVENGAKHGGEKPTISVSVEIIPNGVIVNVTDDGPGLPDQEEIVLSEGKETQLVHGSGIGIWLDYWIVTSHGGAIDVAVSDGTTITITIPRSPVDVEWTDLESTP